MSRIPAWRRYLAFWRAPIAQDVDDELRFHTNMRVKEYMARGMSEAEARRAVAERLGDMDAARAECIELTEVRERRARGDTFLDRLDIMRRELEQSWRALRRTPVYTITAMITLAVGIGAATALFTIVNGTLLRPLPGVAAPDRLVSVEPTLGSSVTYDISYPDFSDYSRQSRTLSRLTIFDGTRMAVRDTFGVGNAWVSFVGGDFFGVFGVRPARGRLLLPSELQTTAPAAVVVLSHDYWESRFGASPSVIGATIRLNGYPITVVGVAAPGFVGGMALHPMDMWIPMATMDAIYHSPPSLTSRTNRDGRVVGRLASGATVTEAERELGVIAARLAATYPEDRGRGVRVYAGAAMTIEERADLARLPKILAAAIAILLLLACANVTNLSLVRAMARRRELATRLALGGSRASLIGRAIADASILAAGSGVLGIALAMTSLRWPTLVASVADVRSADLNLDTRVAALSILTCLFTLVGISIAPVAHTWRIQASAVLKEGGRVAGSRSRLQGWLVVVQVAASLVLLVASAVIYGSVRHDLATPLGFDPRTVSAAFIEPDVAGFDSAQQARFYDRVLQRATTTPGLASAALASDVPPTPWLAPSRLYRRNDEPPAGTLPQNYRGGASAFVDYVTPSFFQTLGLTLVSGRGFRADDNSGTPRSAILSRSAAAALWPHESPIGKLVAWPSSTGKPRPPLEVVGVVDDVRFNTGSMAPMAAMYVPLPLSHLTGNLTLVLRGPARVLIADSVVRAIVHDASTLVATDPIRLDGRVRSSLMPQIRTSAWTSGFAAVALLLSAIGLYGVLAQSVTQRRRELAVRGAVGASPGHLMRIVLKRGLSVTGAGLLLGAGASWAALRLLRALFSEVDFVDPLMVACAVFGLVVVSVVASLVPAVRAGRVDVAAALRAE